MIVRSRAGSLELVTQQDHAGLAADLIEQWHDDDFAARPSRPIVLLATREHDNGWREPDAAPEVDPATRRPYDFITAPDAVKQPIWPRALARLAGVKPLAAALVAEHALTVYARHKDQPSWRQFFEKMTAERERLLCRSGVDREQQRQEFANDYRFVYLADVLSLVFCNGWTDPFEAAGYRFVLSGDTLRISPDPFAGATIPLTVRARLIANRPYESDADLRATLAEARQIMITGRAVGPEVIEEAD